MLEIFVGKVLKVDCLKSPTVKQIEIRLKILKSVAIKTMRTEICK